MEMHCLVKKLLNQFTLSKNHLQLFISIGGINGILLPFINVFKTVQYVLDAVFGSIKFICVAFIVFQSR